MKRSVIILLTILLLPTVFAVVELDMKTEFASQETLMLKVSGNFIEPLSPENIFFYRGHVEIPIVYNVKKIQENHYVYATLPEVESTTDYSIVIKDAPYRKGTQILDEEIKRDFSITNQTADFSIDPGLISTKQDFSIKVQSLQSKEIEIQIQTQLNLEHDGKTTLSAGQSKNIDFKLNTDELIFGTIKLNTSSLEYEVPVYVDKQTSDDNGETNGDEQNESKQPDPEAIQTCSEINGTICLKNEACVGKSVEISNEKCCLDTCEQIEEDDGWKILGWAILVGVIIIIIIFGKKFVRKK